MNRQSVVLVLTLFFLSCLSEKETLERKKIDKSEIERIAVDLNNGFMNDDIKAINKLYDKYALANRFLIKTSKERVLEFNKGFYLGFARQFNFGEILISEKSKGATYDFVKLYKDDKEEYHFLFRFFSAEGINYHDHLIQLVKNQPKIVDTYIFMAGENLSDTYKTIYKSALYGSNFLTKNIDNTRFVKDIKKLKEIRLLNSSGNYKQANEIYQTLSSTAKQQKIYKLVNISTSSNISLVAYQKAIKDYEEKFPNDPSLYLISIDSYLLKKEYKNSLLAIDKLDAYIKGDSFLNFLRANIYFLKKDYKKAIEKYKFINKEYPDFFDAYDSLLALYINTNKNKESIEILDIFISKFEANKEELKLNLKESFPTFLQKQKSLKVGVNKNHL